MVADVSRRSLLEVVAGGAALAGVEYASRLALAASGPDGEEVTIESADGRVERLTVAPTVTVEWEHYRGVAAVEVRVRATGPRATAPSSTGRAPTSTSRADRAESRSTSSARRC